MVKTALACVALAALPAAPVSDERLTGRCEAQCTVNRPDAYQAGAWDKLRKKCYCVDFEALKEPRLKLPARIKPKEEPPIVPWDESLSSSTRSGSDPTL